MDNKNKALVLFSGGLDSMLSAKLLAEQGLTADLLSFRSDFYDSARARQSAVQIGYRLIEHDISGQMRELVKNPPNGYGKNLNPCIDCHGLMLSVAADIFKTGGYGILATGEVLDQRPFSQSLAALKKISDIAGIEVLRPLSAKLLPETSYEASGPVKRHKLFDISGRGRKRQMELAGRLGIKSFSSPAGGCLLTDNAFSERMLRLMDYWPDFRSNDIEIMKRGRNFWAKLKPGQAGNENALITVGRNKEESEILEQLAQKGDFMLQLKDETGPTSIMRVISPKNAPAAKEIELLIPEDLKAASLKLEEKKELSSRLDAAALLTGYYSPKARGKLEKVMIKIKI